MNRLKKSLLMMTPVIILTIAQLASYPSTPPKFFLEQTEFHTDYNHRPIFRLVFSTPLNPLKPINIKLFQVFPGNLDIPVEITIDKSPYNLDTTHRHYSVLLRTNYNLRENQTAPWIKKFRVVMDKDTTDIFGSTLGKDINIEGETMNRKFYPSVEYSQTSYPPLLKTTNIQSIDFTKYRLSGPGFMRRLFEFNKFTGALAPDGILSPIILSKENHTFTIKKEDRAKIRHKEDILNLLNPAPESAGLYGFLVQRAIPYALIENNKYKYDYLKSFEFPLILIHKKSIDFVVRTDSNTPLLWLYDHSLDREFKNPEVSIFREGKRIDSLSNPQNGVFKINSKLQAGDIIVAADPDSPNGKEDFAFYKMKESDLNLLHPVNKDKNRVFIFTDRGIYCPGETIHIGGMINNHSPNEKVTLKIIGPEKKPVLDKQIDTDNSGGFLEDFPTSKDIKKGSYSISASCGENMGAQTIKIGSTQPNEFTVDIENVKGIYTSNEPFKPVVSGTYLAGNPMAGDKLEYKISSEPVYGSVSSLSKFPRFSFFLDERFRTPATFIFDKDSFNDEGQYPLLADLSPFKKLNHISRVKLEAIAISTEKKNIKPRRIFIISPVSVSPVFLSLHLRIFKTKSKRISS